MAFFGEFTGVALSGVLSSKNMIIKIIPLIEMATLNVVALNFEIKSPECVDWSTIAHVSLRSFELSHHFIVALIYSLARLASRIMVFVKIFHYFLR